ncbi:MAG: phospho-N-acetylmuramoyl-pentapeptide-transferase [Christensenellales bacterium]
MTDYSKIIIVLLTAWAVAMLLNPLVLTLMRRLKARQSILKYVDKHVGKAGTPTMGGIIFLLAMAITYFAFGYNMHGAGSVAAAATLGYGLVGFLDDFIKVWNKDNKGLKAYQKVIGQLGVAIIVSVYCYRSTDIGSVIQLPFSDKIIDLGIWYIPFAVFVFVAMTNGVNLTDGLDGLAAKTSLSVYVFWLVACVVLTTSFATSGQSQEARMYLSICYYLAAMSGGLLGFLWLNTCPAKIFMGDTGSLALGGGLACAALFSKNPLILLLVGIMFVVSCISVIVQVIVFKIKGKRVFLMAPFHHHLEYKGIKESKIVAYYTLITIIACVIAAISYMEIL